VPWHLNEKFEDGTAKVVLMNGTEEIKEMKVLPD